MTSQEGGKRALGSRNGPAQALRWDALREEGRKASGGSVTRPHS